MSPIAVAPLDILYADEALIVANKASGDFVHPTSLDARVGGCLLQRVRDWAGGHVHAVHRLDRATSGAVLFARSPAVAGALSKQFELGTVSKRYWAIVRGFPPAEGTIDHPLVQLDADGNRLPARPRQAALTHYRRLATAEIPIFVDRYPTTRYGLLEIEPLTGRRHQIRRHLKHIAHPIIGDANYGKGQHNRFFAGHFGVDRLLLACVELSFEHPVTGQALKTSAPLADDFARAIAELGWESALVSATKRPTQTPLKNLGYDTEGVP